MKKVAVLVSNDINQDQRMQRMCTALDTKYEDVSLVGRLRVSSEPMISTSYKKVRLPLIAEAGVLFYIHLMVRQMIWLFQNRPDVVYAVDADTLIAASVYKWMTRTYMIYDAHEYFTEVSELQSSIVKKRIWKIVESVSVPAADLRITVNESLATIFAKRYNRKFEVIRNVPVVHDCSQESRATDVILYQGVLNKGRGLELLIDYCRKHSRYQLWLVGEGDLSELLRTRASGADNIVFWGWKYGDELRALTQKAWVGVNLLEGSSKNYRYSLANKFFDYVHAGLPSINMDYPEYAILNKKYEVSVLMPRLDFENLDQALSQLVDRSTYDSLVANTLEMKKEYNWDVEKQKLIALLP